MRWICFNDDVYPITISRHYSSKNFLKSYSPWKFTWPRLLRSHLSIHNRNLPGCVWCTSSCSSPTSAVKRYGTYCVVNFWLDDEWTRDETLIQLISLAILFLLPVLHISIVSCHSLGRQTWADKIRISLSLLQRLFDCLYHWIGQNFLELLVMLHRLMAACARFHFQRQSHLDDRRLLSQVLYCRLTSTLAAPLLLFGSWCSPQFVYLKWSEDWCCCLGTKRTVVMKVWYHPLLPITSFSYSFVVFNS